MFVVKDDHAAEGFRLTPVEVRDSEGEVIDEGQLTTEVTSTDDTVVAVTQPDAAGDPTHYQAAFGKPGTATINAVTKNAAGEVLVSKAANFTVTAGDPAVITGGDIVFDALTEAPEAPPAP